MPQTVTTSYRTSDNASTEGRLALDVSDVIWHTGEPSDAPLITLTGGNLYLDGKAEPQKVEGKVKREKATEIKFTVVEKDAVGRSFTVNGAVADTTTTSVTVDSTSVPRAGDIIRNQESGELCLIITVTSATALVMRRNLGSTSYQIDDDSTFIIVGNAFAQGSAKRTIYSVLGASRDRYCQIFKNTWGITNTVKSVATLTNPKDWDEEMNVALSEHKRDIEFSFWMNPAVDSSTNAASGTVYVTRGIVAELGTTYRYDAKGSLDEDKFFSDFAESAFQYGPSRKALFADAKLISRINSWPLVKQQTGPGETKYGLNVREVQTSHGVFELIPCGVFSKFFSSDKQGYGVVLDLSRVVYKYLEGRDTLMDDGNGYGIQTPGTDAKEAQVISEVGLSLRSLAHHLVLDNI